MLLLREKNIFIKGKEKEKKIIFRIGLIEEFSAYKVLLLN